MSQHDIEISLKEKEIPQEWTMALYSEFGMSLPTVVRGYGLYYKVYGVNCMVRSLFPRRKVRRKKI